MIQVVRWWWKLAIRVDWMGSKKKSEIRDKCLTSTEEMPVFQSCSLNVNINPVIMMEKIVH